MLYFLSTALTVAITRHSTSNKTGLEFAGLENDGLSRRGEFALVLLRHFPVLQIPVLQIQLSQAVDRRAVTGLEQCLRGSEITRR